MDSRLFFMFTLLPCIHSFGKPIFEADASSSLPGELVSGENNAPTTREALPPHIASKTNLSFAEMQDTVRAMQLVRNKGFLMPDELQTFRQFFSAECNEAAGSCSEFGETLCGFNWATSCNCDALCVVYGDCCEDFPTVCPETYSQALATFGSRAVPNLLCESDKFLVISSCPSILDPLINDCMTRSAHNPNYMPVTDAETELNYFNKYCALCNGAKEENLQTWQMGATYRDTSDFHFEIENLNSIIQNMNYNRQIYFQWYPPSDRYARRCSKTSVKSCPTSNVINDPISFACRHTLSLVKSSATNFIYNNRFCLLCNELQTCQRVMYGDFVYSQGSVFSALINWDSQSYRDVGGTVILTNLRPSEASPWETARCVLGVNTSEICSLVECEVQFELVEKQCVPRLVLAEFVLWLRLPGNAHLSVVEAERAGSHSCTQGPVDSEDDASMALDQNATISEKKDQVNAPTSTDCETGISVEDREHTVDALDLIVTPSSADVEAAAAGCRDCNTANAGLEEETRSRQRSSEVIRNAWLNEPRQLLKNIITFNYPSAIIDNVTEGYGNSGSDWTIKLGATVRVRATDRQLLLLVQRVRGNVKASLQSTFASVNVSGNSTVCFDARYPVLGDYCREAEQFSLYVSNDHCCPNLDENLIESSNAFSMGTGISLPVRRRWLAFGLSVLLVHVSFFLVV